nr:immunoglobulin heavy chain junction region [Mus musculus]MBK4186655.1 immunoglobulin heavy chain junction region [Mus musculus]MBK4186656.1 immunoglobulin heavy chain junction region [Mus musculus]
CASNYGSRLYWYFDVW